MLQMNLATIGTKDSSHDPTYQRLDATTYFAVCSEWLGI